MHNRERQPLSFIEGAGVFLPASNGLPAVVLRPSALYNHKNALVTRCQNGFAVHWETRELKAVIHQSVDQLPDKCKKAFLLSREENLSYKDISGELKISVSTGEKLIIKALKSIKGNLNPYL